MKQIKCSTVNYQLSISIVHQVQRNKPTNGRPTSPIPDLWLPANHITGFHLRRLA